MKKCSTGDIENVGGEEEKKEGGRQTDRQSDTSKENKRKRAKVRNMNEKKMNCVTS